MRKLLLLCTSIIVGGAPKMLFIGEMPIDNISTLPWGTDAAPIASKAPSIHLTKDKPNSSCAAKKVCKFTNERDLTDTPQDATGFEKVGTLIPNLCPYKKLKEDLGL